MSYEDEDTPSGGSEPVECDEYETRNAHDEDEPEGEPGYVMTVSVDTWPHGFADRVWTEWDAAVLIAHQTHDDEAWRALFPDADALRVLVDELVAVSHTLREMFSELPDPPAKGASGVAAQRVEANFRAVHQLLWEVRRYAVPAYVAYHHLTKMKKKPTLKQLLVHLLWKHAEAARYNKLRDYFRARSDRFKEARRRYDQSNTAKKKRAERRSDPNVLAKEASRKAALRAKKRACLEPVTTLAPTVIEIHAGPYLRRVK